MPKPTADHFDAPRAFALIRRELSYGQRPAGSPQLRRLAQVLRGYEPPADEVPTEHVPTRREAARRKFADLLEAVTAND